MLWVVCSLTLARIHIANASFPSSLLTQAICNSCTLYTYTHTTSLSVHPSRLTHSQIGLWFSYMLSFSESEYSELKQRNCLLVDFNLFHEHFITKLDDVITCAAGRYSGY